LNIIIYNLLANAFQLYYFGIIAYLLCSWVPSIQETKFFRILSLVIAPYLSTFRRLIPLTVGQIDLSPLVALFAYHIVIQGFLQRGIGSVLGVF
jgi:YggT family protein